MKLTYTSLFILLSLCLTAQNGVILDANNTSIYINNNGSNFYDGNNAGYIVPKNDSIDKSTIFTSALWLSALDENNELYVSVNTFSKVSNDYQSGIRNNEGRIKYDRIYVVTSDEIEDHKKWPERTTGDILRWPGNGDTTKGEPWQLAPFEDLNQNGVYEPLHGDYPKIKGEKAAYCIYTDNKEHEISGTKPMNIEIHQMFFQFNESGTLLDETNLASYRLVNRSNKNFKDFRIAFFVDFDLGNFSDDQVGCDTIQNMIYTINGDDNDEGVLGYGINPPSQCMVFLNHKMSSAVYYNNSTNPINGNPVKAADFSNYMKGLFMNGAPIVLDGVVGGVPTKFMFAQDPNESGSWYSGFNYSPSDKRMLGTIGPYDLNSGESICVDLAFVYARSKFNGALGSFNIMKYYTSQVQYAYNQNLFDNQNSSCLGGNGLASSPKIKNDPSFSLYPNPTSSTIHIKSTAKNIHWTIISIHGEELDQFIGESYDASHLSAGMYVLRSELGAVRFVRK